MRARAVRKTDPQHSIPERELRAFDLNNYVGDSGNLDAAGNLVERE